MSDNEAALAALLAWAMTKVANCYTNYDREMFTAATNAVKARTGLRQPQPYFQRDHHCGRIDD